MMSIHVSKQEFETRIGELLETVQRTGERLVISDKGKPDLEIQRSNSSRQAALERLRGSVISYQDPFEPVGLEDWNALK